MRPSVCALVIGGAVALAGCASSEGVVLSPRQLAAYDLADLPYVADRGLLAEIRGNPFGQDDAALAAEVKDALARRHFGPVFPVHTERPQGFVSPYRVVMVFDPAPYAGRASLCERAPASQPNGERVRVRAAFCASDQLLSYVSGSVVGAAGPEDPRFRHLLTLIATELFPPYDNRRGDQDGLLP